MARESYTLKSCHRQLRWVCALAIAYLGRCTGVPETTIDEERPWYATGRLSLHQHTIMIKCELLPSINIHVLDDVLVIAQNS